MASPEIAKDAAHNRETMMKFLDILPTAPAVHTHPHCTGKCSQAHLAPATYFLPAPSLRAPTPIPFKNEEKIIMITRLRNFQTFVAFFRQPRDLKPSAEWAELNRRSGQ